MPLAGLLQTARAWPLHARDASTGCVCVRPEAPEHVAEMKYYFDDFALDTDARELRTNGAALKMEPKVFDVLHFLVENQHRVVSKDELLASVWDGRFISEAAMSSAVRSVRRALGDDGKCQRFVRTMHGRGFRFVMPVTEMGASDPPPVNGRGGSVHPPAQEVRFCQSKDGTRIAYALAGDGPPLVKASNWMNHLEFDWEGPVWQRFFTELASDHQLIRHDARGNGLSAWTVSDFSLERQVEDLEAVVDTLELESFPLLGLSHGAPKAIAYAAKHPDRVTKLVLIGGYARGWRHRDAPDTISIGEARCTLIRTGWGSDNKAIRQMVTTDYMPDAPAGYQNWFTEIQRKTTTAENAARILSVHGDVDIRCLLDDVRAPTLVIHARNDLGIPYDQGQELAAGIRDARFVTLDTNNHLLIDSDPEWSRAFRAIHDFLES